MPDKVINTDTISLHFIGTGYSKCQVYERSGIMYDISKDNGVFG